MVCYNISSSTFPKWLYELFQRASRVSQLWKLITGSSPVRVLTHKAETEAETKTDTEEETMELIRTNKELSKKEIYFLTKAQDTQKMTEAADQTLELSAWAIYTDHNADGEEVELFAMRTVEGETYATNSQTFISAFRDILDVFDAEEITKLKVMTGTSKNNRTYITCAYTE